jgi:hypothetical protein
LQFTYPCASIKDVQTKGEAFSPQKRTSNTSKHEITVSYFCGSFLLSWIRIRIPNPDQDPLNRLNPDPIRIRIRNSATYTSPLLRLFCLYSKTSSLPVLLTFPGLSIYRLLCPLRPILLSTSRNNLSSSLLFHVNPSNSTPVTLEPSSHPPASVILTKSPWIWIWTTRREFLAFLFSDRQIHTHSLLGSLEMSSWVGGGKLPKFWPNNSRAGQKSPSQRGVKPVKKLTFGFV